MAAQYKKLGPEDAQRIMLLQHLTPSRNWTEAETTDLLKNDWAQAYGIWENETLIGVCVLKVIANEAEILELAINPKYQEKGYAQRLWDYAKGKNPDKTFFLEVSDQNTPAINFYKKMGFIQIHSRPNYYGSGNDALIYKL